MKMKKKNKCPHEIEEKKEFIFSSSALYLVHLSYKRGAVALLLAWCVSYANEKSLFTRQGGTRPILFFSSLFPMMSLSSVHVVVLHLIRQVSFTSPIASILSLLCTQCRDNSTAKNRTRKLPPVQSIKHTHSGAQHPIEDEHRIDREI